jgi:hypothetical protein
MLMRILQAWQAAIRCCELANVVVQLQAPLVQVAHALDAPSTRSPSQQVCLNGTAVLYSISQARKLAKLDSTFCRSVPWTAMLMKELQAL